MFIKRKRRKVPGLNTASIADISFTLLILFLVVTSMDVDKGMTRLLPPKTTELQPPSEILERNIMHIDISAQNQLTIDGDTVDMKDVRQRVMQFVDNPDNLPNLPEKHQTDIYGLGMCSITDGHVIQVCADRSANYDTYIKLQNEIVAAYRQLRDQLAQNKFRKTYETCTPEELMALREYYPQRVAEVYPEEKGGGQ